MPGNLGTTAIKQLTSLLSLKGGFYSGTLSGALTMDGTYGNIVKLDPGGAHRDVTLPAEEGRSGALFWIVNAADAAENLVVKDDAANTIVTINQNESAVVSCNGTAWSLVAVVAIALS